MIADSAPQDVAPQTRSTRLARLSAAISARPRLTRWILAGPVTFLVTLLIMSGMAVWVPPGIALMNNIAIPIILFPLIWTGVFLYVCIANDLPRTVLVVTCVILFHVALLVLR